MSDTFRQIRWAYFTNNETEEKRYIIKKQTNKTAEAFHFHDDGGMWWLTLWSEDIQTVRRRW